MAENTIGAQEGALKAGADAVVAAHSAIKTTATQVRNEVEATGGKWVGKGSDDFRTLMREWDAKTERMLTVLTTLGEALGATEKDRVAQEDNVSSSMTGLNSAMSGI